MGACGSLPPTSASGNLAFGASAIFAPGVERMDSNLHTQPTTPAIRRAGGLRMVEGWKLDRDRAQEGPETHSQRSYSLEDMNRVLVPVLPFKLSASPHHHPPFLEVGLLSKVEYEEAPGNHEEPQKSIHLWNRRVGYDTHAQAQPVETWR